jgi:hypothetical protein
LAGHVEGQIRLSDSTAPEWMLFDVFPTPAVMFVQFFSLNHVQQYVNMQLGKCYSSRQAVNRVKFRI